MMWFGASWGAPVNATNPQTAVPVGAACAHCGRLFIADDRGIVLPFLTATSGDTLPFHLDCFLQSVGVNRGTT